MAVYDIQIDQNATFSLQLIWKDALGVVMPLTGATGKMMIKPDITGTAIATLTETSGIIFNVATGGIELKLTAIQTALLTQPSYIYDLFITSAGVTTKLLEGRVIVELAVSI